MRAITKSAPAQSPAVTLAVDLAKDVFELAFADAVGRFTKPIHRSAVATPQLMQACRSPTRTSR